MISVITWGEVLVGCSGDDEIEVRKLLSRFEVHEVSEEVMEQAIVIRQEKKIKMPDAIIWATAKVRGCGIVTRNTKDFTKKDHDVFVPYTLKESNK
jgi:predicted nucleic acid-binding protein